MTRRALLILLSSLALCLVASCGFFQKDDLDVTYTEDFTVDLPTIDSATLCPSGVDCTQTAATADMDRELRPIEVDVEVDVVEQTGNKKLADYAGRFKSVNVTKIEYTIKDNSLTLDLPPLDLYLAPTGVSSSSDAKAVKMATIPATPAKMSVTNGNAEIVTANDAAISELIQSLQVTALAHAVPVVKKGQPFPPSGKATLSITLYVTLVANPVDAIN